MKTKNQKLLVEFNKAFARNDIDFLVEHVTDKIKWTAIGDFSVEGKEAFTEALINMKGDEPLELEIDKVITHGKEASVNGIMKSKDGKKYAFCDVCKFSGFKNPRIAEITSYVLEV